MDDYGFERILKIVVKNLQSGIFFFVFHTESDDLLPGPDQIVQALREIFFYRKKINFKISRKKLATSPNFARVSSKIMGQIRIGQVWLGQVNSKNYFFSSPTGPKFQRPLEIFSNDLSGPSFCSTAVHCKSYNFLKNKSYRPMSDYFK